SSFFESNCGRAKIEREPASAEWKDHQLFGPLELQACNLMRGEKCPLAQSFMRGAGPIALGFGCIRNGLGCLAKEQEGECSLGQELIPIFDPGLPFEQRGQINCRALRLAQP